MIEKIVFEYSISSFAPKDGEKRNVHNFIQDIYCTAYMVNDFNFNRKKIGVLRASKILVDDASDCDIPINELWNTRQIMSEVHQFLKDDDYDDEFHPDILELYDDMLFGRNILIIEHIDIMKKYRGKKTGKYAVKDLFLNFSSGCTLMVSKVPAMNINDSSDEDKAIEEYNLNKAKLDGFFHNLGMINPREDFPNFYCIAPDLVKFK